MKPKKSDHEPQRELFRVEMSFRVDANHPLVKLAGGINWAAFDEQLAPTYHDKTGQPGLDTRLMVALHYLKYQHDLSDEAVVSGCRGHDYDGPAQVLVDRRGRGSIPKRIWRWMKRRAAVEPTIGHLKGNYRLERNRLKGVLDDKLNALFSAAAMNFKKLLSFFLALLRRLFMALCLPANISLLNQPTSEIGVLQDRLSNVKR